MKYIIIALCALLLCACSVSKNKKTDTIDHTTLHTNDSAHTKKQEVTEKNQSEWERQIVVYNHDTTINRYITQPRVIITERGSSVQERNILNLDSFFRAKMDSLKITEKHTVKEKKEAAFSFWQILALGLILAIILFILIPKILK